MLVVLHPQNTNYISIDVPDMQADVHRMLTTKYVKDDQPPFTDNVVKYLKDASKNQINTFSFPLRGRNQIWKHTDDTIMRERWGPCNPSVPQTHPWTRR